MNASFIRGLTDRFLLKTAKVGIGTLQERFAEGKMTWDTFGRTLRSPHMADALKTLEGFGPDDYISPELRESLRTQLRERFREVPDFAYQWQEPVEDFLDKVRVRG